MGVLSLFGKKEKKDSAYILMLYVAEHELYAFAFHEKDPSQKTQLFSQSIDPHLNNLTDKVDVIIEECEKDFGRNTSVYLQKTVFVLHSLYLTDSQTPKEEVRKTIKKVCNELDLVDLGYMTSAELVAPTYGGKHDAWTYAEESMYGFTVYSFDKTTLTHEEKIARGSDRESALIEVRARSQERQLVMWTTEPIAREDELQPVTFITVTLLRELFLTVYFQEKKEPDPQVADKPDPVEKDIRSNELPAAPGFGTAAVVTTPPIQDVPEEFIEEKKRFDIRPFLALLKEKWWIVAIIVVVLMIGGLVAYVGFVQSATVTLTTDKENFAASIPLEDNGKSLLDFKGNFSVSASRDATGEKTIGEKAKGEVTLYNRTYQSKTIPAGTKLTTNASVAFVTDSAAQIASASGVPVQDGSATVAVTAVAVGPEGNISKNTKLLASSFPESDIYAVSSKEFSNGYKKTVIVFSEKDKTALEEAAEQKAKNSARDAFQKEKGSNYVLLTETFTPSEEKSDYSADVGDETRNVDLTYQGAYVMQYVQGTSLASLVQKEKLKDREFVPNTFKVEKISKKDGEYVASVTGKVQKSITIPVLQEQLAGKTIQKAKEILQATNGVVSEEIATMPLSFPLLPYSPARIRIVFSQ